MIIVLKQHAPDAQVQAFCAELRGMGFEINDSVGSDTHILGLIGDTKALAESWVLANPVVETCRRVSEPYKKANRKFHPDDTVVDVGGHRIGGGHFAVMAGPCSVEGPEQITGIARRVQAAGAGILRGGAFKPRTPATNALPAPVRMTTRTDGSRSSCASASFSSQITSPDSALSTSGRFMVSRQIPSRDSMIMFW